MWRDPRPSRRQRQDIDEEDLPMMRVLPLRLGLAGLLALLLCLGAAGVGLAQSVAADVTPEKAKQFLDLMNDPEIKAWLERKVVEPSAAAADWSLADSVAACGRGRKEAALDAGEEHVRVLLGAGHHGANAHAERGPARYPRWSHL